MLEDCEVIGINVMQIPCATAATTYLGMSCCGLERTGAFNHKQSTKQSTAESVHCATSSLHVEQHGHMQHAIQGKGQRWATYDAVCT